MPETHAERDVPTPTKNRPEVIDEILSRIAQGEPYARIHRSDPEKFPHQTTWNGWIAVDEDLAIAHARAREIGFDAIAEECLDIADDKSQDVVVDKDGNEKFNAEFAQRSKLRVWTRLQLLAKWSPDRYGDRVVHAGDAKNPVVVQNDGAALARELVSLMRQPKVIEHKS